MSINNCTFMGRLTADPELKTTQSANSVCKFTVAVERGRKTADGKKIVDFIDCVAWAGQGEAIAIHFKKGQPIVVIGELHIQSFVGNDNVRRKSVEIEVKEFSFVQSSVSSSASQVDNNEREEDAVDVDSSFENLDIDNEELPF